MKLGYSLYTFLFFLLFNASSARRITSSLLSLAVSSGHEDNLSSTTSTTATVTTTTTSPPIEAECHDGVCRLPSQGSSSSSSSSSTTTSSLTEKEKLLLEELEKMGWSREDGQRALAATGGEDALAAASFLDAEQEEQDRLFSAIQTVVNAGWNENAAAVAVNATSGNITAAIILLEEEEAAMITNFEAAVTDMVNNEWDEIVARQALLTQWSINQRRAAGMNTTFSREVLDSIRPTLKKTNETEAAEKEEDSKKKSRKASTQTKKPSTTEKPSSGNGAPKPAKKEDVIFDVDSNNFQKIVIESSAPVLVDIYADWCGPCKQLGPLLEDAAVRAGGMFKLAKVNADKDRSLVDAFEVTGFPTVFAVVNGKITDRFVGMLPGEQIQQFLVRAVTGYGERVQGAEFGDREASQLTFKVSTLAGLSALSGQKKQKLLSLVDAALSQEEAFQMNDSGRLSLASGPATALSYIQNARKDIMNVKYRIIARSNKVFQEKVKPSHSAVQLLKAAGFKGADEEDSDVRLMHSNVAILNLVLQRVDKILSERRFSKMKPTTSSGGDVPLPSKAKNRLRNKKNTSSSTSSSAKTSATPAPTTTVAGNEKTAVVKKGKSASGEEKSKVTRPVVKAGEIALSFRGKEQNMLQRTYSESTTLEEALDQLLGQSKDADLSVEVRFPLPRHALTKSDWKKSLKEIAGEGGRSISLAAQSADNASGRSNSGKTGLFGLGKKNKQVKKQTEKQADVKPEKKKANEYFGGDSTVFLSADDEDDDDDDE